jgi:hypothetical protein|nr:MAG TPA: protein of unknown function (DUF4969) [Caudoviricetes sp.]
MVKRILALLSAASLLIALSACSIEGGEPNAAASEQASAAEEKAKIGTVTEYISALKKKIPVSDIIRKDASLIGAEDGYSFVNNGKTFGLYKFTDKNEIKKAQSGTYKFIIKGLEDFGENTMKSAVNGDFVLLFEKNDTAVVTAFKSVKL